MLDFDDIDDLEGVFRKRVRGFSKLPRRSGRLAVRVSKSWSLFVLFLKPPTIIRRRSTAPYPYMRRTCPFP